MFTCTCMYVCMILVNMCLCISVRKTNVKFYGIMFRAACVEVSKRGEDVWVLSVCILLGISPASD